MKNLHIVLLGFVLACSANSFSQDLYTVEGTIHSLKTEVEGTITLLWNITDDEYRYFAKKGDEIVELKNTRIAGKYQNEYKTTLLLLTSDYPVDVNKTNFTLVGLHNFFDTYNKKADPNYTIIDTSVALEKRLGPIGGISNNASTTNPQNIFAPLAGFEFEVTDNQILKNHALVLQFRHSFTTSGYELTYSQFSLNYRYKFFQTKSLSVFLNGKLVALTFYQLDEDNEAGLINTTGSSLQTPIGLGIGMDYKLGNGFITFGMNDIYSPGVEANGEFSLDFTLGYKFIL